MEPHLQHTAGRSGRGRRPYGTPTVDIDGKALFAARRAARVTIERMAERVRQLGWPICGATIRAYELERSKPVAELVPLLEQAYGVSMAHFVRADLAAAIAATPVVHVPPNEEAKIREVLDDIMSMIAELKAQQS